MHKPLFLFAIVFFVHLQVNAQKNDSLTVILTSKLREDTKKEQLTKLCYNRFLKSSAYDHNVEGMSDSLQKYGLSGGREIEYLGKILVARRKFELEKAESLLSHAIDFAQLNDEKVFLCQFQLNQAYIQTDMGNALRAIYSYRLARKIAETLDNESFLLTTDIGISDIYMNIGLYRQALTYINQAQSALGRRGEKSSTQATIYLNKAEIYFKLGQIESLRYYTHLAEQASPNPSDIVRPIKRLKYYAMLLEKDYKNAIRPIRELLADSMQYYNTIDNWYLAESYYYTEQLELSQAVALNLIKKKHFNAPQIKIKAYRLLAQIADRQGNSAEANRFNTLALTESEGYTKKMIGVGDLSSELKLDRLETTYTAKDLIYRKERTILLFAVIAATLAGLVIFLFNRSIRQKNRYQKLLHQTKARELAIIHSHQVRKPLANILGFCGLIDDTKPPREELDLYNRYLYQEAKEIDKSLREIEAKLRE